MRRHPLVKALGGVVVLLAVGGLTGYAGVRVVQNMVNNNGKSRLDRFTDGSDHPTIVTLGDATEPMRIALPSPPLSRQHEAMTFFGGGVRQVDRVISPAGDSSVQVLWFRIAPVLAQNPESTMKLLASTQASNLGGCTPLESKLVSTGSTAAYQFRVHPSASSAGGSDYYVRILVHGDVVYLIRVEAKSGGAEALAKVVKSIVWEQPARS